MRLARVLTRLNLGGPARQVLASDPLLMERGFELRVFTGESGPGEGDLTDELRAAGVDVRRVPGLGRTPAPLADLRALLHLRRELRAFAPHVVHTHASKAGLLGRLAARAVPGVRRVHTFHGHVLEGYFSPGRSRLVTRLEACLARGTDRVLAVSHATADDLLRLGVVAEERLTVAPPGVNLEELLALPRPRSVPGPGQAGGLRAELGLPEEAVLAGLVGRLAPVKQPLLALEAFLRAAKQAPDLHLVFVGDGPERSSLLAAQTALADSLRARVHLIGAITDRESVFSALDLVVLSSRSEGLPVCLIEGAAAGLPAVSLAVGGVGEVIAHERTGFLAETVDELAAGLLRLALSPGERAACGRRARVRVAKRHGAAALAERLAAVYRAVLEGA
ncbi:MAG TPA: glycosyltransferase [Planctomycetota bacterium]|jgi:glycosyltransferase involved in cell wall biosynthesis|nr:glycosyltransferase [Planctomycetota bacterium]